MVSPALKYYVFLVLSVFYQTVYPLSYSIGSTDSTYWQGCNFTTIEAKDANAQANLKMGDTTGLSQTFTAKDSINVGEICLLLQRLETGLEFNLDIYELHNEGAGAVDAANAVKLRYSDPKRSTLIRSFLLRPTASIVGGAAGDQYLAVLLDADEQFWIKAGQCYSMHIYAKSNSSSQERVLVWNYNNENAYLGGRYGTNDGAVTVESRDFGLALRSPPIVHDADSDTYVMGADPENVGKRNRLIVRSLDSETTPRGSYAYIRFDLGRYQQIKPGARFSLTRENQRAWSEGELIVYGLPKAEGLTPQDWVESQLSYSKTGVELKALAYRVDPLNASKLIELGPLPASNHQKTVSLQNSNLDSFLNSRAGKMVTLIIANRFAADRLIIFGSKEGIVGPKLLIRGDYAPVELSQATSK